MKTIIAILPSILLSIIFYLNDRKKAKKKIYNMIILLILGAIGSYICYRFEMHYGSYFKKVKDSNYFEILYYAIFGVSFFEEGYKWIITNIVSCLSKKESSYDLVSYSVFSSIGFLTFENVVYYVIPYGLETAISRIFTAIPSHICFAIIMGYFLQKGYQENNKKKYLNYFLGLFIPVFTHAYYNSFLYGNKYSEYFIINYILIIGITLILFIKMNYKDKKLDNDIKKHK